MRELNEREVRAVSRMLYETCVLVRTTLGRWLEAKHRPTRDELLHLGIRIKHIEDEIMRQGKGPPTTGHDFDLLIEGLSRDIEKNSPGFIDPDGGA